MDAAATALVGNGIGGGRVCQRAAGGDRVHLRKMIEAVARQPEAEGRVGKYMDWVRARRSHRTAPAGHCVHHHGFCTK